MLPISIRLTRWVKKIRNANLDEMNDIPFTVAPLSDFRDAWTALKNEVSRRSLVEKHPVSSVISQICDSAKCAKLDCCFDLKTSATYRFMRCSRCQSSVYCSKECQKDDWIDGHKRACRIIQQNIKGGIYPRVPGNFEMKFAQQQLTVDYEGLQARICQLRREFVVRHPNKKDLPIPWLDYTFNAPPAVSVYSLPEIYRRVKDLGQDIGAEDLRSAVALAVVPWRGTDRDGGYIVRI
ncbi:hypothetical protein AAF712_008918 [Marasmius tenuissimus]|uniref:MYND-type domain-containing protein n=1 Tax=Marasmius tenuissimus TaxID=585030 RepID=A0ABR2ZRI6_9AGAR